MASIRLNNVSSFKDRHGKTRWRFRKKGFKQVSLPGQPGETNFMEAYKLALAGKPIKLTIGKDRVIPGSVGALIVRYLRSVEYQRLAPSTQKTYRRIFGNFKKKYGRMPLKGLERKHIKKIMSDMGNTPGAADSLLRRLKMLMGFALDEGMITIDPTLRLKGYNLQTDGFRVWTEDEIAQFKKAYPSGSRERLALALLLCTAARGSDVARLGRQHIKDGKIRITAQKTKTTVTLPVLPELQKEIAAAPANHLTFLVTAYGKPFSIKGFQQWFAKKARQAGIKPELQEDGHVRDCTAHGLRKSAATRLANAGCTDRQIMAVTGHQTVKALSLYTASRDQEIDAEKAIQRLNRNKPNG